MSRKRQPRCEVPGCLRKVCKGLRVCLKHKSRQCAVKPPGGHRCMSLTVGHTPWCLLHQGGQPQVTIVGPEEEQPGVCLIEPQGPQEPSEAPMPPAVASASAEAFDFDGLGIVIVYMYGRPYIPAVSLARALEYSRSDKVASNLRLWSDEMKEGPHYLVVTGAEARTVWEAMAPTLSVVASSNPGRITLLTIPGVQTYLMRSGARRAMRFRAWLVNDILPSLQRGERALPGPTSPVPIPQVETMSTPPLPPSAALARLDRLREGGHVEPSQLDQLEVRALRQEIGRLEASCSGSHPEPALPQLPGPTEEGPSRIVWLNTREVAKALGVDAKQVTTAQEALQLVGERPGLTQVLLRRNRNQRADPHYEQPWFSEAAVEQICAYLREQGVACHG